MEVGARKILGVALAAITIFQVAWAGESIRLRRGLVVPVRFQDELSLKESRRGDRFTAVVDEDRDLPRGTLFQGHVADVERAHDDHPGFMDLDFDTLLLPDGSRQRIDAVPIRMDDKTIRRGSEGRYYAKKKLEDTSKYVIGGMAAGYLMDRILGHRRPDGIMIGAIAGIIVGESERNSSANEIVVKRDSRIGALIKTEASFEIEGNSRENRNDPRHDRREEGIVIEFRDRELRFSDREQPFREGETWMVPLVAAARQVGMNVDDNNSRRIYVEDDDTVLILEQDSRNYRLNGKRAELPQSVMVKDNVVYVPIDALVAAKSGQIKINRTQMQRAT